MKQKPLLLLLSLWALFQVISCKSPQNPERRQKPLVFTKDYKISDPAECQEFIEAFTGAVYRREENTHHLGCLFHYQGEEYGFEYDSNDLEKIQKLYPRIDVIYTKDWLNQLKIIPNAPLGAPLTFEYNFEASGSGFYNYWKGTSTMNPIHSWSLKSQQALFAYLPETFDLNIENSTEGTYTMKHGLHLTGNFITGEIEIMKRFREFHQLQTDFHFEEVDEGGAGSTLYRYDCERTAGPDDNRNTFNGTRVQTVPEQTYEIELRNFGDLEVEIVPESHHYRALMEGFCPASITFNIYLKTGERRATYQGRTYSRKSIVTFRREGEIRIQDPEEDEE